MRGNPLVCFPQPNTAFNPQVLHKAQQYQLRVVQFTDNSYNLLVACV